jgi:hypothetical protein
VIARAVCFSPMNATGRALNRGPGSCLCRDTLSTIPTRGGFHMGVYFMQDGILASCQSGVSDASTTAPARVAP